MRNVTLRVNHKVITLVNNMLVRVYATIILICIAIGWYHTANASTKCVMNDHGIHGGITCEKGWLIKK